MQFFPALLLHTGVEIRWFLWTVHWSTAIGLGIIGALYFWRARQRPGTAVAHGITESSPHSVPSRPSPTPGQRAMFLGGLFVIFASLNGPIHDLSDYYLFSAHMVQHLMITLIAPPLLLAGTPGWMVRPLLDVRAVRAVASRITRPVWCYAIFNVVVAAWHLPAMYNTAMAYHEMHIVQHIMFMIAAVLMWWPLMSPLPELPRLAYPGQMLYCFLMVIPMSIVAIYIAMAERVLYPAYAVAPRMWGIPPMQDQLLGGLIMWIPGGLFFYGVMTVVFFKWASRGQDSTAGAQVDWAPAPPPPLPTK